MTLTAAGITVTYNGVVLKNIPDAFDTITNPAHAKLYMKKLRRLTPHADVNVGYMTGYYDAKTMRALQKRFGVSHPIFGRKIPTARQAFAAGQRLATATVKKGKRR